jgi:phage protein D
LSPHYYVRVRQTNGEWTDITDRVTDVIHTDKGGGGATSRVELPINNFDDWALREEPILRKGARYLVSYGYPGRMREAGEFVAKEQKGNSKSITVTAYERKRAKRSRQPKSRTWYDKTRSEVVREVLSGQGLDPSALHITATTERLASITQAKEHPWEFAEYLARLEGFELWSDEGGIYWQEPPRSKAPTHLFRYVRGVVGIGLIKDYNIDSFGAGVPGRVLLHGRDPHTKRSYRVEGSDTATKGLVELVDSDDIKTVEEGDQFDEGDTGFEIERNIGSRTEQEAQLLADSIYKDYKYNALKLNLTVFLDPSLRTFTNIFVWGLNPSIDGIYSLRNATHRVGAKESTLQIRRAGRKKGSGADSAIDNALRNLLGATSNIKPLTKLMNFLK